jgi:transcriptional regulator with XRE-family HTH domain
MDTRLKIIHANIKDIRQRKNFSQAYMAEKMNIALLNYGKIERGVTELSVKRLYEIADILDVNVLEIIGVAKYFEMVEESRILDKLENDKKYLKNLVDTLSAVIQKYILGEETEEAKANVREERFKALKDLKW